MNPQIHIEFDNDQRAYQPGGVVDGTVRWQLDETPERLELFLFWHTSGKGTNDVSVIDSRVYENVLVSDEQRFSFTLPQGPYSFSGKLITLQWSLELTVIPKGITVRKIITLSPSGSEITLKETYFPKQKKSFGKPYN